VDERRRRAWQALELGPAWRLDGSARSLTIEPGEAGVAVVLPAIAEAQPVDAPVPLATAATTVPIEPVTIARSPGAPASRDPVIASLDWSALNEAVGGCAACGLCRTRRNTVFGVGPRPAAWMLVGEAPGEQEDERGEPFVGPAGRLLDQMLAAIGVDRPSDAFIANVLKCRPPGNRNPSPEEVAHCEPYLQRQVALLQPHLIVVLGRFAAQSLLRTEASIASLRGRVHRYREGGLDVPLVVTYHPAYLLRSLPEKGKAWADLRLARRTWDALAGGA
jgi:uracil-DNA glycosylase